MRMRTTRDERPGRGDTPAPVITDEGTWGEPPPWSPFQPAERRAEARAWTTIALAAVVIVWLCALSVSQLTARQVAIPVAMRGIAAVTEIDALIDLHATELCTAASAGGDATISLTGFPVQDVLLRANEVRCPGGVLDRAGLRDLVLARAGDLLYLRGTTAFTDPDNAPGAPPALSSTWTIRLLLDNLGSGLHEWATLATWGAGVVGGLLVLLAIALGRRGERLTRVGWAAFLGALPVLLAAAALWTALLLFSGTQGDSMLREFLAIGRALTLLPMRDAALVALGGLALVLPRVLRGR
jgi:hypothetical protein